MDGLGECGNPRCTRYVIVRGIMCCEGCLGNLADPDTRVLYHSSACDDRQQRYAALVAARKNSAAG